METLTTVLVLGFGLVLFAGVTVRLVLALRRRRPGSSLRDSVLRPLLGASAVSVLPTLDTRTTEHLNHHGPAHHPAGTSLEEPWPDARRDGRPDDREADQHRGPNRDQSPDPSRE
ncbi:hypothetical protein ACHABX_03345 [Nesterenkonia halotolerans]|uniref:hypothetical protein n=1 Tax=Nesterenkonia halotolerans TaxID=225325 RepID=UPI003EE7CB16